MIAVSGTVNIYFHVPHCSPHFLLNIARCSSRPQPRFTVQLQSISELLGYSHAGTEKINIETLMRCSNPLLLCVIIRALAKQRQVDIKNKYVVKHKSAKLLMTYAVYVGKLEAALNISHLILSTSSQRVS